MLGPNLGTRTCSRSSPKTDPGGTQCYSVMSTGPIDQPLSPNPPGHKLAKVAILREPQVNRVLHK